MSTHWCQRIRGFWVFSFHTHTYTHTDLPLSVYTWVRLLRMLDRLELRLQVFVDFLMWDWKPNSGHLQEQRKPINHGAVFPAPFVQIVMCLCVWQFSCEEFVALYWIQPKSQGTNLHCFHGNQKGYFSFRRWSYPFEWEPLIPPVGEVLHFPTEISYSAFKNNGERRADSNGPPSELIFKAASVAA